MEGTFTCGSYSRVEGTFTCGSYSHVGRATKVKFFTPWYFYIFSGNHSGGRANQISWITTSVIKSSKHSLVDEIKFNIHVWNQTNCTQCFLLTSQSGLYLNSYFEFWVFKKTFDDAKRSVSVINTDQPIRSVETKSSSSLTAYRSIIIQWKCSLCCVCLRSAVLAFLPLTQEIAGSNTTFYIFFYKFCWMSKRISFGHFFIISSWMTVKFFSTKTALHLFTPEMFVMC